MNGGERETYRHWAIRIRQADYSGRLYVSHTGQMMLRTTKHESRDDIDATNCDATLSYAEQGE
jgi:hypothetical protein